MSAIEHNDRVLVMGKTGSGKSVLLNVLASGLIRGRGAQVLFYDSKPEYAIQGVEPVSDVSEIDWTQPVIHYRTSAPPASEVARLFDVLQHRRRLTVITHELSDLCEYNAGKTPGSVNAFLSKGRAFGLGLWGGTQRPVNTPKRILTDAEHVFAFATGFTARADMEAVSQAMGLRLPDLEAHLRERLENAGEHSYLHFDRREGRVSAHDALTQAEVATNLVMSPTLY